MSQIQMIPVVQGPKGYSSEVKQDVLTKMLALGNQRLVSKLTGVEYATISTWKKTDWWQEMSDQLRLEQATKLDTSLSSVVEKSLEVVADRLENGEHVLNNKTGALIRKPVSMRDSARVASDLLARQSILRKVDNAAPEQKESMKDILGTLAREFAKYAKKEQMVVDNLSAEDIPYVEQGD